MKAITIENLIAHIRPLRTGKRFLYKFVNDCEIIDVMPMENIDNMKAEIEHIKERDNCTFDCIDAVDEMLDIINKYCKGE